MKNNLKFIIVICLCFGFNTNSNVFAQSCYMDNINPVNFAYQGGTQTITVTFTQYDPACANESFEFVDVPSWLTITHVSQFGIQIICQANNGAQRTQLIGVKLFGNYVNGFPVIQAQSCHKNWYPDSDGDGFGDKYGEPIWSCTDPSQPGEDYIDNNSDRCPDDANTGNYGCPADYVYENINWISSKAYDIDGNLKANSKAYFNDLGKPMQSQSVDIKTNRTWANQTLYDAQGRPALSTLSAPINSTGTPTYKADFIRDENNHIYDSADFENTPENPTEIGKETTNTLGWYYSDNNTDSYHAGNNYQDETDYPFSRTIYSELNPGAALKTIGGNKQNNQWKQGYTFSMPAGQELSRAKAFNDAAYNTIKTIKTVSKDVHGYEVVVFTDTDGKTLAAARVGGSLNPDSTVDISTQGYVDVHVPYGTTGFTINGVSGITTEVYNLITEQTTTTATSSLTNGFYRVSITNLDSYNPTTPATTVSVTYKDNYYDYSLNEYDEAGRLIASYQPVGNTKAQKPVSTYSYNAVGQLLSTTSPDEGTANFKYRKDGQIRFSQNSKQLAAGEFSYTNYDDLGRPIESGVATGTFSTLNADTSTVTTSIAAEKQETTYDALESTDLSYLSGVHSTYGNPSFLAGNVAKTSNVNTTTYYSYDVYGRVKWVVQNILGLGTKTIDYKYDQITGAVTEVDFQKNTSTERFIHKYTYDAVDNSLVKVETSNNGSTFTTHANYTYYETGALKRIELAPANNTGTPLQNIDYVYNLNGQLKAINPGNDDNDLFSMQIDYHDDDYKRSVSNISTPNYGENRYNGDIKGVRWKNKELPNPDQTYSYYYNKNNWLKDAVNNQNPYTNSTTNINIFDEAEYNGVVKNFTATNSITWLPGFYAKPSTGQQVTAKIEAGTLSTVQSGDYNVFDITYDANGNIRTLNRNKNTENSDNKMDQLGYVYNPEKPNQLLRVDDAAGDAQNADDIDDQDGNNYEYNSIGQLVKNNEENIDYIYNAIGLVTEVKKDSNPLVKFFYNDKGHRVKKENHTVSPMETTYYVRDVSGTALAIYNGTDIEHTIYGANRLGVYNRTGNTYYYQLTDHLGNVRAVTGRGSNGNPIAIVSATDYYPFGMPMPNRNIEGNYRYKYQGQEKDIETGKEAFQLRLWDGRIGRWLTPDPAGQYASPYLGMGNNPVNGVDPDGGKWFGIFNYNVSTGEVTKVSNEGDDIGRHTINYIDGNGKRIGQRVLNGFDPGPMSFGNIANSGDNRIIYSSLYWDIKSIAMNKGYDNSQSLSGIYNRATQDGVSNGAKATGQMLLLAVTPLVAVELLPVAATNFTWTGFGQSAGTKGFVNLGTQLFNNGGDLGKVNIIDLGLSSLTTGNTSTILGSTFEYSIDNALNGEMIQVNSLKDIGINFITDKAIDKVHGNFGELFKEIELTPSVKTYKYIFEIGSSIGINTAVNQAK